MNSQDSVSSQLLVKVLLVALGFALKWVTGVVTAWFGRRRLRTEFRQELQDFHHSLQHALQARDWHSENVKIRLDRLQEFLKEHAVSNFALSYRGRATVHHFQTRLLAFSEAMKRVGLPDLPLEIRLQLESPILYDKSKDPMPKKAPLVRVEEGLARFRQSVEAAKSGNTYAAHVLLPLAQYVLTEAAEVWGSGRAGAEVSREVRSALEETGVSFAAEIYRRMLAETEEAIASLE